MGVMEMKSLLRIIAAAVMAAVMLGGSGCNEGTGAPEVDVPIPIYDDGQYLIEQYALEAGEREGRECLLARLRITNRAEESVVLSSVIGLRVLAGGDECALLDPAPLAAIDGLIAPGETAEGYVAFAPSEGATEYSFELAMDYAADHILTFPVSP